MFSISAASPETSVQSRLRKLLRGLSPQAQARYIHFLEVLDKAEQQGKTAQEIVSLADGHMKKTKRCPRCGETKPIDEFYKNKGQKDGLCVQCKMCHNQRVVQYKREGRKSNKEWHKREVIRLRELPAEQRERYREASRKWKIEHQQRVLEYSLKKRETNEYKARMAVHNAVNAGNLPRVASLKCKHCGERAQQYHHESYARKDWLKVIPLCRRCHGRVHQVSLD